MPADPLCRPRPLWYQTPVLFADQGWTFFASEVKALHASGVKAAWDEEGFLQVSGLAGNLDGRTHFREVRSIPPAHYLVANSGIVSTHQYWDFDYPEERYSPIGETSRKGQSVS